jgi:hypothetical protein
MMSLQEMFVASRGAPVVIDGKRIVQMDRLPIRRAMVTISADATLTNQGIALKTNKGGVRLSNGVSVSLLHTWFDSGLPLSVSHFVECQDGELRVWNIYRTKHPGGSITEDAWTGNAGMLVENVSPTRRRYLCSPGYANGFDPHLAVLVGWEEI